MERSSEQHAPTLASFLRENRERLLTEWEGRVRSLPPARGLNERELRNHLPRLLDRIAGMVEDMEGGNRPGETEPISTEHALERLDEGYDLQHVVREFSALRRCILDLWVDEEHRRAGGPVLNDAIDEAMTTAVDRFTAARERTLVALDRIAATTSSARSLDDLLMALTTVLLETTASVDSVAIYLGDGRRMVLRAAAGLERELEENKDIAEIGSETCVGRIAATGKPLEMRTAATDPRATEPLRRMKARAFFGVPVTHDGEIVGVAHVASRTAFEFSQDDKFLFRSMVDRATSGVVQWQLREELERERRHLSENEARLRHVFESGVVGHLIWDSDHRIIEANDAFLKMIGYERTDVEAGRLDWWKLTPPEYREETLASIGRVRAAGVSRNEKQFWRKDGSRVDVLLVSTNLPGNKDRGIVVALDITEQKRAERERAEAHEKERAMRAQAERALAVLTGVFAGAPVGLYFIDRDFRYVRVNQVLAAFNGKTPEEHEGRTVREVLPSGADPLEAMLRQVVETGEMVNAFEVSLAPPSTPDRVRDWQLYASPVRLPDGSIVGIAGAVIEITALKQALRVRDDFLAVAAHDLRSPLASMRLLVENMKRTIDRAEGRYEPDWLSRKLGRVVSQIDRVNKLLMDLLDVSKIHASGVQLELEELDIAALVRDVAFRHGELLANANCELRVSAYGSIIGQWDALRLEQILSNLISNAAKYGAGQPVEIRAAANEKDVVIIVRDHGVGIEPDNIGRIFQRFQRVGDRRATAGTGLGLWIVKSLVAAMGGSIEVESEPGNGSTFRVVLPRRPLPSSE